MAFLAGFISGYNSTQMGLNWVTPRILFRTARVLVFSNYDQVDYLTIRTSHTINTP